MSKIKTLLASLGEPGASRDAKWLDYQSLGINHADVPELIALAQLATQKDESLDEKDAFVSLHAWRALAEVGNASHIPVFVGLLVDDPDCDWLYEDLTIIVAAFGAMAIPYVEQLLVNLPPDPFIRGVLIDGLSLLCKSEPENRNRCVEIMARALADKSFEDPDWNSMLVAELAELQAIEYKDLIEEKFVAGLVSFTYAGDWEEAQIKLGLLEKRLTPRPDDFFFGGVTQGPALSAPRAQAPKAKKAKRSQQKKARKAQRKKKKR